MDVQYCYLMISFYFPHFRLIFSKFYTIWDGDCGVTIGVVLLPDFTVNICFLMILVNKGISCWNLEFGTSWIHNWIFVRSDVIMFCSIFIQVSCRVMVKKDVIYFLLFSMVKYCRCYLQSNKCRYIIWFSNCLSEQILW